MFSRGSLFVILALAAAMLIDLGSPASAAYPGRSGLIVYRSCCEGTGNDLWTMNPDGTGKTNITNVDGFDHDPSWAFGGGMLVFQSHREEPGDAEIWVSNADGSNSVNLTQNHDTEDYDPVFAPDNKMIAWAREDNSGSDIWVMNADGSAPLAIGLPTFDYDPAWGPTNRIAYGRDGNIWAMDPDGGNQLQLTNFAGHEAGPNWSPDGTKVAFSTDKDGQGEIYVMNADGSSPTRLTNHPDWDFDPGWSPDGTMIVFGSDRSGNDDIWVMNANGSNPVQLTTNDDEDAVPDWQPIPLVGDTNCDGVVRPDDALPVVLAAGQAETPAICLHAGNVVCDDALGTADAIPILRYSANLEVTLPQGCREVAT